jgi:hypothetical protein
VLIHVSFAEIIWDKSATTNGRPCDIQQHIAGLELTICHFCVRLWRDERHIIKPQAIEMHVLTTKKRDSFIEVASSSPFGRNTAPDLRGDIFNPFDRPSLLGKGRMQCCLAEVIESFELVAFGGDRRVNRRATCI